MTVPSRHLSRAIIPPEVLAAEDAVRNAGGEVYIVGGAIRDLLLGRPVRDWDLATNLTPDRLPQIFPKTREVGAHFGTVLVTLPEGTYEVTTFRRDGVYSDGRRPDEVEYTQSVNEDLARRDLTINAFAYDSRTEEVLDLFDGRDDLAARRLRMVGDPDIRFEEDALRLLRVVRFAVELDFEIERITLRALTRKAPGIERVSGERIREEMKRIMTSPQAGRGLELLFETGLLRRILPELDRCYGVAQNSFHSFSVFHHCLAAVDQAPRDDEIVRWAALFHDVGKPETREVKADTASFYGHQQRSERHAHRAMNRMRFPKQQRDKVAHLVLHHMFHYTADWSDGAVRRFMRTVGVDQINPLFRLRAADTMGNGMRTRIAPELAVLRDRVDGILEAQNALGIKDLSINGRDLMAELSIRPGPQIGQLLEALLAEVLESPEKNERDLLLARAGQLFEAERNGKPIADASQAGPKKSSTSKAKDSST